MLILKYIHMKMLEIINNTLKFAYNQAQIRRIIQEHKQADDDWEIQLDRISLFSNDYHRSGSQGDVILGRLSNSPVAVKRVRDKSLADIRHLKDLNHKNIIKFIGVSRDPRRNFHYIIMEWCSNGTLAQKLHDPHPIIAPSNLCDFAQSIASGMKYLHSKNIIHRDLKPSNILLTRNYEVKISDFGTHKVFGGTNSVSSSSQTGTFPYMAPEVIRGELHSFSIDVWSYGVVLWEMFVGLTPYHNLDSYAVVWAVANDSFHLPIPTGFPEGMSFILKGCWHAKASERMTFQQICMMLKAASPDLSKIPKERWQPTQASWRKEARDKLQRLNLKTKANGIDTQMLKNPDDALDQDEIVTPVPKTYDSAVEQAEKLRIKNLHMQLNECSMLVSRERREVEMRAEEVTRRERSVERLHAESSSRLNELNQLKELVQRITDELDGRGIVLECLQGREYQQSNEVTLKQREDSDKNDQEQKDKIANMKQVTNAINGNTDSTTTNL